MPQFAQEKMNYFLDDSHGQVDFLPSPQYQRQEDQNPLFLGVAEDSPTNSTRQQTNTSRREHTAVKVSLTVIHKILYWQPRTTKKFKQLLSQINKKQNNSTALKFILLAQKADLIQTLKSTFDKKATDRINELKVKNQWSEMRFQIAYFRFIEAIKNKNRISQCIRQRSILKSLKIIWQNHNHEPKYIKSQQDVNGFAKKIKRITKNQLRRSL